MEKDIYSIIRKRYPESEYALMQEVSDKAGFSRSRSADFIVMNLWPSRGLSLNGIELKSFRGDWLSEKKKPQKAENIFQYCDYFWLLTTDDTVAKLEEIPETWGWLCIKGERIHVKKDAPKLSPASISRHFLAALLKRACSKEGFVRIEDIQDRIDYAAQSVRDSNARSLENMQQTIISLRAAMEDYKKETGIDLLHTGWRTSVSDIGKAVKFVTDGGVEKMKDELFFLEKTINNIQLNIQNGLASLKERIPPKPQLTPGP